MHSIIVAVAALLPFAQDPAPPGGAAHEQKAPSHATKNVPDVTVEMGNMVGRVVAQNGDKVRIEFIGHPGAHVEMPIDLLPPEKRYWLQRAHVNPQSAQDWMQLADWAEKHDLRVYQVDALQQAAKADPSLNIEDRVGQAQRACALERLDVAKRQRADGDLQAAIDTLQQLTQSKRCPAPPEANEMLQTIQQNLQQERQQAKQMQQQRESQRKRDQRLSDVQQLIDGGNQSMQQGLEHMGSYATAKNDFGQAIALYEAAYRRLQAMEPMPSAQPEQGQASQPVAAGEPGQPGNQGEQGNRGNQAEPGKPGQETTTTTAQPRPDERERMLRRLEDHLVDAHVQLGHVYAALGADTDAYQQAGEAAAIRPNSEQVLALRQAIAASQNR